MKIVYYQQVVVNGTTSCQESRVLVPEKGVIVGFKGNTERNYVDPVYFSTDRKEIKSVQEQLRTGVERFVEKELPDSLVNRMVSQAIMLNCARNNFGLTFEQVLRSIEKNL